MPIIYCNRRSTGPIPRDTAARNGINAGFLPFSVLNSRVLGTTASIVDNLLQNNLDEEQLLQIIKPTLLSPLMG